MPRLVSSPLALMPLLVLATAIATAPSRASAANVLVVSDALTDTNIASVLRANGHAVTLVTGDYMAGSNPTLRSDLTAYDCVFWSATANGFGGQHFSAEVFTSLTAYVSEGGRVFVTGYNSISYPDPLLIAFLGGTSAIGYPGDPGLIASVETSLTVGPVDIRGVMPYGSGWDYDALVGLTSDTMQIAGSSGFGSGGAQWTLRTLGSGEIAYVSNGEYAVAEPYSWSTTTAGPAGAFNAAIRNFAAASEGAASEPGAPRVRFDAPFGAIEGAAIDVTIEVTDEEGDPVTWSWDTDGDGVYGELPGETTFTIPAGITDGEGTARVAIEATDGTHTTQRVRSIRVSNVAPSVESEPPTTVSVDQVIHYTLQVNEPAGAADPLVFRMTRGPSSSDVTTGGTFRWIPGESDVTTGGRDPVHVTIEIDDGDEGITIHDWLIEVSPNHAPSTPVALHPVGGVGLIQLQPRLVVQNGNDLDGDALQYLFEIDSVETFDSADLRESGPIDQTPGYTAWSPTPLHIGHWHWRARATDGVATTDFVVAHFYVVPDPATIPDAAPSDGGTTTRDGGAGPDPRDRGCACRAVGTGRVGSSVFAVLAGLAIALAMRRRR